ncbi:Uncharacterized protein FWK35_00025384, partial [Aphis craccivora]
MILPSVVSRKKKFNVLYYYMHKYFVKQNKGKFHTKCVNKYFNIKLNTNDTWYLNNTKYVIPKWGTKIRHQITVTRQRFYRHIFYHNKMEKKLDDLIKTVTELKTSNGKIISSLNSQNEKFNRMEKRLDDL